MEIINQTPFEFAPLAGRIGFPDYSLTLIIKGTFDMTAAKQADIAEIQLPPTGDERYADDAEGQGSLRYASDFAFFKPRADILLVGSCHTPGGTAMQTCPVILKVGTIEKQLMVFGHRRFQSPLRTISAPEPFTTMELRYENSFGGAGYKRNPTGKGFGAATTDDGRRIRPLPNIEQPGRLVASPFSRPDPAGFGPIDQMWPQRYGKVGTYRKKWQKERWPWFPEDFDWQFFNAAPADMQVDGYLQGDESLSFQHLHAQHPLYHSQLPGIRPRCFISRALTPQAQDLVEVPLCLDTLWVDMASEKAVLVWRGVAQTVSEDYEDIHHLYIDSEKPADKTHPATEYANRFIAQLNASTALFTEEVPDDTVEADADVNAAIAKANAEAERAQKEAEEAFREAGIDTGAALPPPSEEDRAYEAQLMNDMGIKPAETPLTRETIAARLIDGESLAGEDLSNLDLSGLDMSGADLQGTIMTGATLEKANLNGARLDEAILAHCNLREADLGGAKLNDADLTLADLSGADLRNATLDHAACEQAVMKGVLLSRASARSAIFKGSDLSNADLKGAVLEQADFSMSTLDQADFESALLKEASVEAARGVHVHMLRADLSELRASEGCVFPHGNFRETTGGGSVWEGADLSGADFSFADFPSALFTAAVLDDATLTAADMPHSVFRKATLQRADCRAMNLFQGSLEKADITGCDFSGANLYEVEFLDARAETALFRDANLKMTKLA